jgi:putative alpha-1,2-mannosidase
MNPDYDNLSAYRQLGWVPCDQENESVSKTLEYACDDYCVAQMAKALGKQDDYQYFLRRAENFTNLYDSSIGLMRPKDAKGQWRTIHNLFGGGVRAPVAPPAPWGAAAFLSEDKYSTKSTRSWVVMVCWRLAGMRDTLLWRRLRTSDFLI